MIKSGRAGIAQLVEQLIRNQQVSGSSPLAGSRDLLYNHFSGGDVAQLGERHVRNVEAAGSIPAISTKPMLPLVTPHPPEYYCVLVPFRRVKSDV